MTNEQMKAGRFLRWHKARAKVAFITAHLNAGHTVVVATMTKATRFDRRHLAMFKATKSGAYVQRGKAWDCIDYASVEAFA
jgi:hypothetical protein